MRLSFIKRMEVPQKIRKQLETEKHLMTIETAKLAVA